MGRLSRRVSKGLIAFGAGSGDSIGVLSRTRLEWVACDLGAVCIGCVTVGIYPSMPPVDCAHILNHSESTILFAENREQLDKIAPLRGGLPRLRHFVIFDRKSEEDQSVPSWEDFLARGDEVHEGVLRERGERVGPGDVASLGYATVPSGEISGAMITHRNLVFTSWSAAQCRASPSPAPSGCASPARRRSTTRRRPMGL